MERVRTGLILVILVVLFGCREGRQTREICRTSNLIYDEILYVMLDSLADKHDFNNKILLHKEIYPDQLKISTLENTLMELEEDNSLKTTLIRDLRKIIGDSILLNISTRSRDYDLILDQQVVQSFERQNTDAYIINLSKVAFDKDKRAGCFYFAIHCGQNCSSGYLIYIKKVHTNWEVAGIIPRWHS